jgi:hypothetical protein
MPRIDPMNRLLPKSAIRRKICHSRFLAIHPLPFFSDSPSAAFAVSLCPHHLSPTFFGLPYDALAIPDAGTPANSTGDF